MQRIGIYKIICAINNKVYIGQSVDMIKRKASHFYYLRNDSHRNEHLQRAFNKYGEEFFKYEILEECYFEKLDEREEHYMKLYKSLDRMYGYNIMKTEHKKYRHSLETKEKISKSNKGKTRSEETKRRLSIASKGRIMPTESIEKMRIKRKGQMQGEQNNCAKISDLKAKEILIFLMTKELLTMSMGEIAEEFNVPYHVVVNLKQNKSYKHILTELREKIKSDYANFNVNSNSRIKYNENPLIKNIIIEKYKEGYSQSDIARELKCSRNTIRPILIDAGLLEKTTKRPLSLIADEIVKMYKEGNTMTYISKLLACDKNSVSKVLKERGIIA
jgi:group I intron endonuclease